MRKSFHKKGSVAFLASIILIIVAMITVMVLYGNIRTGVKDLKPYLTECKLTLAADKYTEDVFVLSEMIEHACFTVKLDDANYFKRPNDLMTFMGNRMAQSWWVSWEGTKSLWNADAFFPGYDCVVMFDLDYTHPKLQNTIPANEFYEFLITQNYSEKDMTYNRYLQGKKGNGGWLILDDIEPGKNYAVMMLNPHEADSDIGKKTGGFSGLLAGKKTALIGAFAGNIIIDAQIESALELEESIRTGGFNINTIIVFSTLERAQSAKCMYNGVNLEDKRVKS